MSDRPLVIYDGGCRFCIASVRRLRRIDREARLDFADARAPEVADQIPGLDPARALERMHLALPDRSELLAGWDAVRALVERLPRLGWARPLVRLPGADRLGHFAYDFIARRRFLFGRCDAEGESCRLPDE